MPPRRTSLQVDVSRDLYIVCAFMYQGMPHQQAQAFTVAHNPQKALADCGAASLCFAPWETPVCSRLFHGAKTFGDYIFESCIGIKKRKKKQIIIARGIFGSLAPLLGLGNCRLSLGLWYRADDTGT